ncbi:MAG: glutathione S-transferase family protein [Gammaproteobacteria bacterium]|jgi:glutathione S-transferase|nr:glutathione S-transferase family protein [Gammaproteobacteria bacterium]
MGLELVSFVLCPYVQRAAIVLREKDVPHQVTYIDLEDPPDWFHAISPFGKVPLLRVGDQTLFESAIICEYLDEVYPPRLHPGDALERARHRAWAEFGASLLIDQYELVTARTEGRYRDKVDALRVKLERLEGVIDGEGPFFSGSVFRLVDATFAPFFMRHAVVAWLRPELGELLPARTRAWSHGLLSRPAVEGSVVADLRPRYLEYFEAKGGWLFKHGG